MPSDTPTARLTGEERRARRKRRRRQQTRDEILDIALEIVVDRGVQALTVDEVARVMGLTKPAIYYYFKSKTALVQNLVHRTIGAEMQMLVEAVEASSSGAEALGSVVHTFVEHYRERLDVFRVLYLYGQLVGNGETWMDNTTVREYVHPVTMPYYDAIEAKLLDDRERGELAPDVNPRRLGLLAQTSAIGLMTLIGLVDAAGDPLKHSHEDLASELARALTVAARTPSGSSRSDTRDSPSSHGLTDVRMPSSTKE